MTKNKDPKWCDQCCSSPCFQCPEEDESEEAKRIKADQVDLAIDEWKLNKKRI